MTFFRNSEIFLSLKFLWLGLIMGLVLIIVDVIIRLSKRNVYIYNIATFCFFLGFGGLFAYMSLNYYNYSFCWFGLVAMIVGTLLVKISIKFIFDKIISLIYNRLTKRKKRRVSDEFS